MIELSEALGQILGPDLIRTDIKKEELTAHVYTGSIVRSLVILRDHPRFLFKILIDICGVDYPEEEQRFQVVYHLLSVHHNVRIRLKVLTNGSIVVPSVTEVFKNANWYEREVWDMFGIPFADHPDLRRLLTDYGFDGHPLRKDFPLTGYVEVRYDDKEKRVVTEPISLPQEFRTFDFLSPWEGMMAQEQKKPEPLPLLEEKKANA